MIGGAMSNADLCAGGARAPGLGRRGPCRRFTSTLVGRFYEMNTMEKEEALGRARLSRQRRSSARQAAAEREQSRLLQLADELRAAELRLARQKRRARAREVERLRHLAARLIQAAARRRARSRRARLAQIVQCAWRSCRCRAGLRRSRSRLDAVRRLCARYATRLRWRRHARAAAAAHAVAVGSIAALLRGATVAAARRVHAARTVQRAVRCRSAKKDLRRRQLQRDELGRALATLQARFRFRSARRRRLRGPRATTGAAFAPAGSALFAARMGSMGEADAPPELEKASLTAEQRKRVLDLLTAYSARHWGRHPGERAAQMGAAAEGAGSGAVSSSGDGDLTAFAVAQAIREAVGVLVEDGGFAAQEVLFLRRVRQLGRRGRGPGGGPGSGPGSGNGTAVEGDEAVLEEVQRIVADLGRRAQLYRKRHQRRLHEWERERQLRRSRVAEQRGQRAAAQCRERAAAQRAQQRVSEAGRAWLQRQCDEQRQRARRLSVRRQRREQEALDHRWAQELALADEEARRRQEREARGRAHEEEMRRLVAAAAARRRRREELEREAERVAEEQRRARREAAHVRGLQRRRSFMKDWRERQARGARGEIRDGSGNGGDDCAGGGGGDCCGGAVCGDGGGGGGGSASAMHESLERQTHGRAAATAAGAAASAVQAIKTRRRTKRRKSERRRSRRAGAAEGILAGGPETSNAGCAVVVPGRLCERRGLPPAARASEAAAPHLLGLSVGSLLREAPSLSQRARATRCSPPRSREGVRILVSSEASSRNLRGFRAEPLSPKAGNACEC